MPHRVNLGFLSFRARGWPQRQQPPKHAGPGFQGSGKPIRSASGTVLYRERLALPRGGQPLSEIGNYDWRTERRPNPAPINSKPNNPNKGSELPVFGSFGAGAGDSVTWGAGAGGGIRTGTSTAIRIG